MLYKEEAVLDGRFRHHACVPKESEDGRNMINMPSRDELKTYAGSVQVTHANIIISRALAFQNEEYMHTKTNGNQRQCRRNRWTGRCGHIDFQQN